MRSQRSLERQRIRDYLMRLLGGKCAECGYSNFAVLEFHHLRDKEFNLSGNNLLQHPFEVVKKEAKKCKLLCCRCHKELHIELDGDSY